MLQFCCDSTARPDTGTQRGNSLQEWVPHAGPSLRVQSCAGVWQGSGAQWMPPSKASRGKGQPMGSLCLTPREDEPFTHTFHNAAAVLGHWDAPSGPCTGQTPVKRCIS